MELAMEIEYVYVEPEPVPHVIKQVWDGKEFITVAFHRVNGALSDPQKTWLTKTFGKKGHRWNHSASSSFWIADEQVLTMFRLRWN
jgi:hypothetical protein